MSYLYKLQKFDSYNNKWRTIHIYNISEHKNAESDMYNLYQINKDINYRLVAVNEQGKDNSAIEDTKYLSCLSY